MRAATEGATSIRPAEEADELLHMLEPGAVVAADLVAPEAEPGAVADDDRLRREPREHQDSAGPQRANRLSASGGYAGEVERDVDAPPRRGLRQHLGKAVRRRVEREIGTEGESPL